MPAWREGETALLGVEEIGCINCHEPHQPQIALLDITKSHPLSSPSPPPPPGELLAIVGIALLLTTGIGVVIMIRGERA